ncbi:serine hydrolase domain-containing protein [Streptomyces sp. NPDC058284]|uniref:serine hydrolase domain-containing protein n=1 Tax=unclassified Streptomyces TaxID=2593676 RepID=UPI003654B675
MNTMTTSTGEPTGLDPAGLWSALDAAHRAGMPGIYAEVRAGEEVWRGAAGVADLDTGRPVGPDMRQRVGSVTKSFTAAAVLQQAERGLVRLDAPVGGYLPRLVPGERGRQVTVRMLLNHTSGFSDYLPRAFPSLKGFPSLADASPESLDDNRFREFAPEELIAMGLAAPPGNAPGGPLGTYSNTNYLLLGQLLQQVTGLSPEECITRDVIEPAGLRHTSFPSGPHIEGPHSRMYEALYGLIDPPRDYSVYDMSWVSTGAGLVSTMADLNRFYALLLGGEIVDRSSLAQMQRTVPVRALDGSKTLDYGLGLHRVVVPGAGTFWGHDGTAWGAGTLSLSRADGGRQLSFALNLMRWNSLDSAGKPRPHPIDGALAVLHGRAAGVGVRPRNTGPTPP